MAKAAGSLQRPSVNITTNRLFTETDLLPLSLTSENFDMFLEYYMCYFASFVTVRQYITKMVIIVYVQPLTFVWISCLLFEFMSYECIKVSWDLCLLVMWQNWKIKRDLPVSWSLIEIISPDIRRRENTCPPLSHPPSLRQFTGLFLLLAFSACMLF